MPSQTRTRGQLPALGAAIAKRAPFMAQNVPPRVVEADRARGPFRDDQERMGLARRALDPPRSG